MNTRIQKLAICLSVICLSVAVMTVHSAQGFAVQTSKKKTVKSSKVKQSQDNFQLTLSTVPYSSDPNSDYVRLYCAPEKGQAKKK